MDTRIGLQIIAFVVLSLSLMIAAFVLKKQSLMVAAGLSFAGLAMYMRTLSSAVGWTNWDVYMLFFWLSTALSLTCFLEMVLVGRKAPDSEEEGDIRVKRIREIRSRSDQIGELRGKSRRR